MSRLPITIATWDYDRVRPLVEMLVRSRAFSNPRRKRFNFAGGERPAFSLGRHFVVADSLEQVKPF